MNRSNPRRSAAVSPNTTANGPAINALPTIAGGAPRGPLSRIARIQAWPVWSLGLVGAAALWLAQPPVKAWPIAWVALVPWILIAARPTLSRRDYAVCYAIAAGYWALTMQGLRHAHPAMYATWAIFAAYLATYPVLWIAIVRAATRMPNLVRFIPIGLILPITWVGLEWVRNHFATGISAVMLGHTQADLPLVIQIADTFGSFGVSFLVAIVNAAVACGLMRWLRWNEMQVEGEGTSSSSSSSTSTSTSTTPEEGAVHRWGEGQRLTHGVAIGSVVLSLLYGGWRLNEASTRESRGEQNPNAGLVALIGRDEAVIFEQDIDREVATFDAYVGETLKAAEQAAKLKRPIAAIVWPESMFTGGVPHVITAPDQPLAKVPGGGLDDPSQLQAWIDRTRLRFKSRAADLQRLIAEVSGQSAPPQLLVGCSVIRYSDPIAVHCGFVQIANDGEVTDFYAKQHLVMFGEYIPLIDYIPFVDRWIPAGMGVTPGIGPTAMRVGDQLYSPNICIETAVERVTLDQVRTLRAAGQEPTQIVNVTNDAWFDHSSVVEHHLRAAQFVAVGCRKPILIAANGGPTAWIDGSGRIRERLANDASGSILVEPRADGRVAPYLALGELPAGLLGLITLAIPALATWRRTIDPIDPAKPCTSPNGEGMDRHPPT